MSNAHDFAKPFKFGGKDLMVRFNLQKVGLYEEYKRSRPGSENFSAMNYVIKLHEELSKGIMSVGFIDLADLIYYGLYHERNRLKLDRAKIFDWMGMDDFTFELGVESVIMPFVACVSGDPAVMGIPTEVEKKPGKPKGSRATKKKTQE